MTQKLEENQAKVEKLTKDWTEKWKEAQQIMQVYDDVVYQGPRSRGARGARVSPIFLKL